MIGPNKLYDDSGSFTMQFVGTADELAGVPTGVWIPAEGDTWYDTEAGYLKVYDGSDWVSPGIEGALGTVGNGIDSIQFNTTHEVDSHDEGLLHWNTSEGGLEIDMPGGEVTAQVPMEQLIFVKNQSGSTISNGLAVYIKGASAIIPTIALASNDNSNAIMVAGIATEDIETGSTGYVTTAGLVRGLNTLNPNGESWTEGDHVYLGVDGVLSNVHPPNPTDAVIVVGTVTRRHATEGSILVDGTDFTVGNEYDGTMRQSVINQSDGVNAAVGFTAINDANRRATFGIGGSNNTDFPNVTVLYGEGYGPNWYAVDGNQPHVWFIDVSDSHDNSALLNKVMEMTAAGALLVGNTTNKGSAKIGDGGITDYFEIESDGTMKFNGAATVWDDVQSSLFGRRLNSQAGKVDYNYTENTITFESGGAIGTINDRVNWNIQMYHSAIADGSLHPHVHFEQVSSNKIEFRIAYRIQNNGAAKTASWTEIACNTDDDAVFSYSSGTLNQIVAFPAIDLTGVGVSGIIEFRMVRDDSTAGDIEVTFVDCHYEKDTVGSRTEFAK